MCCTKNNKRNGLSLVEVVISSLLVGTVLVGAMSMLGASISTRSAANDLMVGPLLADMLLGEIMAMPYSDPEEGGSSLGLDSGESGDDRTDFDDIDDYKDWSPSDVEDRLGNPLSEYTDWTREATVSWTNRITGNEWTHYDSQVKRIVVLVTSPAGVETKRIGWRSRDGSLEQPPTINKTVVIQVETTLSVGSAASPARGVSNLVNHAEDPNEN